MPLRDYQQHAHDAAFKWIRGSVESCIIEAATGAGKSHIIAALAESVHSLSGKHILCLAPSAELVEQNREKYLTTGQPASIFSSSAGSRCLKHPVVFGTPGTVKNAISRFGSKFALIIIDEAHGITPTIKKIIECIQLENPKVRVVGLSATPYRLGSGYIYKMDEDGKPNSEKSCRDPYFTARVYNIQAHELIDRGFLTPPLIGAIGEHYETLHLELNSQHKFNTGEVDKAFVGHGRLTSQIVAEVVHNSHEKKGVMLFAATIQHAEEILASLPYGNSHIITSKTKKKERKELISGFKRRAFKYFVNVGVLTTGFDASHIDHIAILRATESVALLQQIVGRGLRLGEDKDHCLVSDYGQNIERHCPDGDLFSPEIKASYKSESSGEAKALCELCETENTFSARKNDEGFEYDDYGYFVDLDGNRIESEFGPIPSHHGRRCQGLLKAKGGKYEQCAHRWTSKKCPSCDADNDIAARYCSDCRAEIIDPNEKLALEFKQMKRNPMILQTDRVVSWEQIPTMSRSEKPMLRVSWTTEYRKFQTYHITESDKSWQIKDYEKIKALDNMPETVTYKKDAGSGFYKLFNFNQPADEVERV